MKADLIIYQFPRERIEVGDCSHVLAQFDVKRLSSSLLRDSMGRVVFCVSGYDSHPDELHAIPAVRRFLREWRAQSPFILFFGSLHDNSLKVLYLGLLDSLEYVKLSKTGQCRTNYQVGELADLLAADLTHADALCVRLGISQAQRLRRATDVLRYFGLDGGDA